MVNETRFLPPEIKDFWRLFEIIAYKYQYYTVFDDFLTMCINWFANGLYIKQRDEVMKKYSSSQKHQFNDMFKCLISSLEQTFKKHEWFDFFGTIYEAIIINKGKQSGLGQFFTPPEVVDILVQMNFKGDEFDKTIYDPTAGSGRMLIAAHVYSPKNYVYAADIDIVCCKMCLLNMFFHGCKGEVVHMDSLNVNFFQAWFIDIHPLLKVPFIGELREEQSFIMNNFRIMEEQKRDPKKQQQINFNTNIKENSFFESIF